MNSWLPAGLLAVTSTSGMLALTYLYLYSRHSQPYLLIWGGAWLCHVARNLCVLANVTLGGSALLLVAEQWFVIATAWLLLLGTMRFLERPAPRSLSAALLLIPIWPPLATAVGVSPVVFYLPTYLLLGSVKILTGLALLRATRRPGWRGGHIAAWSLILWGLHQFDYPFLRHVDWFAPFGFMLGALLAMAVALGMVVIFFERLSAKQSEGEQCQRAILQTALEGYLLAGPQAQILDVNEAYCAMTGYSRQELLGLCVHDLDVQQSPDEVALRLERLKLTGRERFCTRQRKKGGEVFDVEVSARLLPGEEGPVFAGFLRDITARAKAEVALRANEAHFRTLAKVAPVGIFRADARGRCFYVNDQWAVISGHPKSAAMGLGWLRTLRPQDRRTGLEGFRRSIESGRDYVAEFRFRRPDGQQAWFLLRAAPEFAPDDGSFRGFVGAIVDISQRKAAEQALAEERRLLESVIDGTSDAVFVKDAEGRYLRANAATARAMGRDAAEIIGCDDRDLFPARDAAMLRQLDRQVMESGRVQTFEEEVTTAEGRRTYLATKGPLHDAEGRVAGIFGISRDITERARAEEAFRSESLRRSILMERSNDGIVIIDKDHRVVEANQSFAEMLGYTREEAVGLYTWQYEALMGEEEIRRQFRDLADVNLAFESRHRRKDGSTFDVEVSISGTLVGGEAMVLAVCRDISARRETEAALRQAKEAAEAANRAKSSFLANMSHEIRTPLNGLLGMLQLIKVGGPEADVPAFAEMALRSGLRLTKLLNDILDLSRIEAGRMAIAREPLALAELLTALTDTFSPVNLGKDLQLAITVAPDTPEMLLGDGLRLRQLLLNLVGNAVKFTDKGRVEVGISRLADAPDGRARLLFLVSDTGIGIPEDKLDDILAPFSQVVEDLTRAHQGAGLGLAIVRNLALAMGGGLCIDSEVGAGTSVALVLPFALPHARITRRKRVRQEQGEAPARLRVLLVEDEEVSRLAGRIMLERMGHEVRVAANGFQALDALRAGSFDCVLMDVQMDGLDGVAATRMIRGGEAGELAAGTPIIAMTAYAMTGDREQFLAAGMDDYVPKPVELEVLSEALKRVTGQAARK